MGLGRAEQYCTLCLHMPSCLYSTVKLPSATLVSVVISNGRRTKLRIEQAWNGMEKGKPMKEGQRENREKWKIGKLENWGKGESEKEKRVEGKGKKDKREKDRKKEGGGKDKIRKRGKGK